MLIIDTRVAVAYRSNRLWAYAAWDSVPEYPARFASMLGRTSPLLGARSDINLLIARRRHAPHRSIKSCRRLGYCCGAETTLSGFRGSAARVVVSLSALHC